VMHTKAIIQRCREREICVVIYENILGSNALSKTSDTGKGRVCFIRVLRRNEFLLYEW